MGSVFTSAQIHINVKHPECLFHTGGGWRSLRIPYSTLLCLWTPIWQYNFVWCVCGHASNYNKVWLIKCQYPDNQTYSKCVSNHKVCIKSKTFNQWVFLELSQSLWDSSDPACGMCTIWNCRIFRQWYGILLGNRLASFNIDRGR